MSDDQAYGIAAGELRQFIEQYEQLDAEKSDVAERQKELMAEAKARGYDTKVMRKVIALRKRDKDDLDEEHVGKAVSNGLVNELRQAGNVAKSGRLCRGRGLVGGECLYDFRREQYSAVAIGLKVHADIILLSSVVEMFHACGNTLDRKTLKCIIDMNSIHYSMSHVCLPQINISSIRH